MMDKIRGIVFDIQKFCTYDGPGIRTSVFLKGCMMHCPWCHNPESMSPLPQLSFNKDKCINCMKCKEVCPMDVHHFTRGTNGSIDHIVDFKLCSTCGKCVKECPQDCLSIFGKRMTSEEVLNSVAKDKKYFDASGGGITVTGGEPTCQTLFLNSILEGAKKIGISTCIETNGVIGKEELNILVDLVDVFLVDYKATGDDCYALTGVSEDKIIDTLDFLEMKKARIILRCPIIPTVNDNEAHFRAIRNIREKYHSIESAEIMPYHSIGVSKWHSIGMPYSLENLKTATQEMKNKWTERIELQ
jgi:glycyl-radical enzyme activating protein